MLIKENNNVHTPTNMTILKCLKYFYLQICNVDDIKSRKKLNICENRLFK